MDKADSHTPSSAQQEDAQEGRGADNAHNQSAPWDSEELQHADEGSEPQQADEESISSDEDVEENMPKIGRVQSL